VKNYVGTYSGIVRENKDPIKLGRIKAFVPLVFGVGGQDTEQIGLENIPWALPAGMPAGGSAASGGMDWIPEVGDQVWVRFLDGEPEKPIWEWGMQTIDQAKNLALHDYDPISKKPRRAAFTRYGNVVDLSDGTIVITTKNGYTIVFTNSDKQAGQIVIKGPAGHQIQVNDEQKRILLQTALGQILEIDDQNNNITLMANENIDIQSSTGEISSQAASLEMQAFGEGINIKAATQIKLTVGGLSLTISPSGFNFGT
jgi:hypothetical protein